MSTDASEAPGLSTAQEMAQALEVQDKPDTSQAPPEAGTSATQQQATTDEAPDPFGDNFDPSSLPPELQPAYKQLRGDYTRKTQELAEQRKQAESANALIADLQSEDPDTNQQALAWMAEKGLLTPEQTAEVFGWDIEQPQDDEGFDDPTAAMRQEWEQFKAEREAERQQAQLDAYVAQEEQRANDEFTKIEADLGSALSDRAKTLIVSRAVAAANGQPLDIRAAFDELEAEWNDRQQQWANGKTAPVNPGGGQTATEVPDLANERQRVDYMAEQIEAVKRSQGLT